jgi:hypothetical protein
MFLASMLRLIIDDVFGHIRGNHVNGLNVRDEVWGHFVNGDSRKTYIPYKRGV